MRLILLVLAFQLSFFLGQASAVGARCGLDNYANSPCPAPDADGDGYPTTTSGYDTSQTPFGVALDCDDTNSRIFPGRVTKEGSDYKECQTDGTYINHGTSLPDLSTGPGSMYVFDCTSGDNSSPGTELSPKENFNGFTHTRGDWYWVKGNCTYSSDFFLGSDFGGGGSEEFFVDLQGVAPRFSLNGTHSQGANNISVTSTISDVPATGVVTIWGVDYPYTSANGTTITLQAGLQTEVASGKLAVFHREEYTVFHEVPGEIWEIDFDSASITAAIGMWLGNSSYIRVSGVEVHGTGNVGILLTSDFSIVEASYIHDIGGNGDQNNSGVYISGALGVDIKGNRFVENYGDTGNNQNDRDIVLFRGTRNRVLFNSFEITTGQNSGTHIGYKHADNGDRAVQTEAVALVSGNQGNGHAYLLESGQPGVEFVNNFHVGPFGCVKFRDLGGITHHVNLTVQNNTCLGDERAFEANWSNSWGSDPENIVVYNNVFQINTTVGTNKGYVDDSTYFSDALYDLVYGTSLSPYNGQIDFDYNCWYNQNGPGSGGNGKFRVFENSSSAGATYDFTGWQADDTSANQNKKAFDLNGFEENPLLDTAGIATSTNCVAAGAGFQAFGYYSLAAGASVPVGPQVIVGGAPWLF